MVAIENLERILAELKEYNATFVAVSKTKTVAEILQVYHAGQRIFGENKVQELCEKYEQLPKDIEWHLIGHLQTNKVKYIAPFVSLIHSVDSLKLLKEINKQAEKNNRVIDCLLQLHIAKEETKFGMTEAEAEELLKSEEIKQLKNVRITGLMGIATLTEDENIIRNEFRQLSRFFSHLTSHISHLTSLSMGMSHDYKIALDEGSNMVRIGSLIFGERK